MRIGVDLAAHEDLRRDLADQLAEQPIARRLRGAASSQVVSRSPSIRVIVSTRFVDDRDRLRARRRCPRTRAATRPRLVVELLGERARELARQRLQIDAGDLAERAGDRAQRGDVGGDHVLDARDLDLDDDARAVEQRRGVDLREARGGERRVVERREQLAIGRRARARCARGSRRRRPAGPRPAACASSLAHTAPIEIGAARCELAELRDAAAQLGRVRRGAPREIAMIFFAQVGLAGARGLREPQPALAREHRGRGLREPGRRAAWRASTVVA